MCHAVLQISGSVTEEDIRMLLPEGSAVRPYEGPARFQVFWSDKAVAVLGMQDDGLHVITDPADAVSELFYQKLKAMHKLNGKQVCWAVICPDESGKYRFASEPSVHALPDQDIARYREVSQAYLVRFYLDDIDGDSLFAKACWSVQDDEPLVKDLGPHLFRISNVEICEALRA